MGTWALQWRAATTAHRESRANFFATTPLLYRHEHEHGCGRRRQFRRRWRQRWRRWRLRQRLRRRLRSVLRVVTRACCSVITRARLRRARWRWRRRRRRRRRQMTRVVTRARLTPLHTVRAARDGIMYVPSR